jgi:hypothetical protein
MMSYLLNVDPRGSYLYISVTGENTYDNIVRYLSEVRDMCIKYECPNVLIVENLVGPSLRTMSIYDLISSVSKQTSEIIQKIAYVDINPAHDLGDMKFAENVAVNRGVPVRVFSTIIAAEQWMASQGNSADNE